METLTQDLRFAARVLLRRPAFLTIAVLSLALGIGANTAIFSLVNELFLRPLPIAEPDRVMRIFTADERAAGGQSPLSHLNWKDLREQNRSFDRIAGWDFVGAAIGHGVAPLAQPALLVSGNYFETLGVSPERGRFFLPEEDGAPGTHPVAVLHHGYWRDVLGGTIGIGDTLRVNGQPFTLIGIAPPGFDGLNVGFAPAAWFPMAMHSVFRGNDPTGANWYDQRRGLFVQSVGRLRDDVDHAAAQADLDRVAAQLERDYPDENQGRGLAIQPVAETTLFNREQVRAASTLLQATVALVLLIACANVANLLLGRAAERRREIAIRLAMGVSRARLMRQLLTESLLVSIVGGALGLVAAVAGRGVLRDLLGSLPAAGNLDLELGLDGRVLTFTALLSIVTGLLFGFLPAFQSSRPDLVAAIKDGGAGAGSGRRRITARNGLVVAQTALAVVALIGAGLFLRSLAAARAVDLGYDTERLAVIGFDTGFLGMRPEQGRQFFEQARDRIAALPGVEKAALSEAAPLQGTMFRSVLLEGENPEQRTYVQVAAVGPGFFDTLGVTLEEGRPFDDGDRAGSVPVVVINRAMADRYWPGERALGRRFRFFGMEPVEVIGITEVLKYNAPGEDRQPYAYLPAGQYHATATNVLARTAGDPGPVLLQARSALQRLHPDLVINTFTGADAAAGALDGERSTATLLAALGTVALLLAAIGIYGVMAWVVRSRTREIGIRMAMGAQRSTVLRMVLLQGLALSAMGALVGTALALGATRLLTRLLYVSPQDPLAFALPIALLALGAVAACLVPAWRAVRVSPAVVLRWD
jgi:predicted permease